MKKSKRYISRSILLVVTIISFVGISTFAQKSDGLKVQRFFLIGDSTVNNSSGDFRGWGNVLGEYFDPAKAVVINRARGGRSSRTFITEGLWDQVVNELKLGDVLLIQFGHNDGGSIDKEKARGSLKGVGDETKTVVVEATGKTETVRTYGSYMSQYISDALPKKVTVVVLSPVPRNIWKDGKVVRASADYGKWARQVAEKSGTQFVDLNEIVAAKFESVGEERSKIYFTNIDHTHTSLIGAKLNAESVVQGLLKLEQLKIKSYLLDPKGFVASGK